MKHLLFFVLMLLLAAGLVIWLPAPAPAQPSPAQTVLLGNPPGGSGASCNSTKAYLTTAGVIYTCTGTPKTWTSVGSGGGAVTIPQTTTDISTPAAPTSGKTAWYTKGGLLCAEDPSAAETCTVASAGTLPPWNPVAATPPTDSNWTFVNGTSSGTHGDARNSVYLTSSGANATNAMHVATPGSSGSAFTLTAYFTAFCLQPSSKSPRYGIFVSDGTKATALYIGGVTGANSNFATVDYSNTIGGAVASEPFLSSNITWISQMWLRIKYDGTNLIHYISPTGDTDNTFTQLFSATAASNFSGNPSRIGFSLYNQDATCTCRGVLGYWKVTQP